MILLPAISALLARRHNNLFCKVADRSVDTSLAQEADGGQLERVHVVYTANREMFPGLLTSMVSLARNLQDPGGCTIHVVLPASDLSDGEELVGCFKREIAPFISQTPEVDLQAMKALPFDSTDFIAPEGSERFLDPSNWAKLVLHEYLPESAPRAIYLDVDTIVQSDMGVLYRMRMQHVLAALQDSSGMGPYAGCIEKYPDFALLAKDLVAEHMFNAGIMLLNLSHWRTGTFLKDIVKLLPATRGCMGDQYALNIVLGEHYDRLPWTYNVAPLGHTMSPGNFMPRCMLDRAAVLHWAGRMKPWSSKRNAHYDRLVEPYAPRGRCGRVLERKGLSELYTGPS